VSIPIGSSAPIGLRIGALATLFLLLAQFLVGMAINIYVAIPPGHPGSSSSFLAGAVPGTVWAITAGRPAVAVHTALGVLLAVDAVALLVLALVSRRRAWIAATALGLVGMLAAGMGGIGFLNYGRDFATFLMAAGFTLAVGSYMAALYVARPVLVREFG
jgi:hypothetical protein